MADRLLFEEDQLRSIADRLIKLENRVGHLSREVRTIAQAKESVGEVVVNLHSFRLHYGCDFGGSASVQNHVEALTRAMDGESMAIGRLGKRLHTLCDHFVECEKEVAQKMNAGSEQQAQTPTEDEKARYLDQTSKELIYSFAKGVRPPNVLLSYFKDDETGLLAKIANGAWALLTGDLAEIVENDISRFSYCWDQAFKAMKKKEVTLFDEAKLPPTIVNLLNLINKGEANVKEFSFETFAKCLSDDELSYDADMLNDLFDTLKEENIGGKDEILKQLKKMGLEGDDCEDLAEEMSGFIGFTNTYGEVMKGIDAGQKIFTGGVECLNEYMLLTSLDDAELESFARTYLATDDPTLQQVGHVLNDLAGRSDAEKMVYLASSELLQAGMAFATEQAFNTIKSGVPSPYGVVIDFTTAAIDTVTGVNDVPKLTNQLSYSVDTAQKFYDVLQKDIAAYEANPSDANLEKMAASYQQYCNTAAQAESACGNIYKTMSEAALGGLTVSDEARGYIQQAQSSAESFEKSAQKVDKLITNLKSGVQTDFSTL